MKVSPVRAKVQTQLVLFCPRLDCETVTFLGRLSRECPSCRTLGIRCSYVIELVDRDRAPITRT